MLRSVPQRNRFFSSSIQLNRHPIFNNSRQINGIRRFSVTTKKLSSEEQSKKIIHELDDDNFYHFLLSPKPLIVDCYATWCEPCKKLTPLLEEAVNNQGGQVLLGKVDIDECPTTVNQLNVSSVPTVFAIYQQQIIQQWTGVQPKDYVQQFVAKIADLTKPNTQDISKILEEGELELDVDNWSHAGNLFGSVVNNKDAKTIERAKAIAGIGVIAALTGQKEQAIEMKNQMDRFTDESFDLRLRLEGILEILNEAEKIDENLKEMQLNDIKQKTKENLEDLDLRYNLALLCAAQGKFRLALNECFSLFKQNQTWKDGKAKKLLLKLFNAAGPHSSLTKKYRQNLANLIF